MIEDFPYVLAHMQQPWAILPMKMEVIHQVLLDRIQNGRSVVDVPMAGRPKMTDLRQVDGEVAVIRVQGTILSRSLSRNNPFSSGMTSYPKIAKAVRQAVADDDVGAIVLELDSPGGMIAGCYECGQVIREAAKIKPIHAVAEHMACSAAYWLGSQATSFAGAPNSYVASIGVISAHYSYQAVNEKMGVKVTPIHAGRRKNAGSPDFDLPEEEYKAKMRCAEAAYDMFVQAVAEGRRVSAKTVMSPEWGEGAAVLSTFAVEHGIIDRISTVSETVTRLKQLGQSKRRMSKD